MQIGGFRSRASLGAALLFCLIMALTPLSAEAANSGKYQGAQDASPKRCPALIIAKCTPPKRPQCVRTQNGCCVKLACRKR
jgi:hypothetical protein